MKTLEQIIERAKELNNTIELLQDEIKNSNFNQSIQDFNNKEIEKIHAQLKGLCFASDLRLVEFIRLTS